ncbi:PREDICTED: probable proteasome inhibitor [Populus euphratica]|uniref:Probable proteasome inhibitor n=1 Tax=Populus euphratica TaxID=75702 RepID=A0AAJ6WZQ4_POPEU|nr:PREDICTED: probable proteasome inhibitor [Populus euphratica]
MFCPPELAFPAMHWFAQVSCWSAVSFIQFPAIMKVHFLFSDLLFRYVVPPIPVNPMSDLYPGAGAGMYPTGAGRGGGMLIGPDDPSWSGLFGDDPGLLGRRPGVPPGARFDPFGPPGVPGFEPNRFIRGPRRPGSNIHPDLSPMGRDPDFI